MQPKFPPKTGTSGYLHAAHTYGYRKIAVTWSHAESNPKSRRYNLQQKCYAGCSIMYKLKKYVSEIGFSWSVWHKISYKYGSDLQLLFKIFSNRTFYILLQKNLILNDYMTFIFRILNLWFIEIFLFLIIKFSTKFCISLWILNVYNCCKLNFIGHFLLKLILGTCSFSLYTKHRETSLYIFLEIS